MLPIARWLTLALAILTLCGWAAVSGLRLLNQRPPYSELATGWTYYETPADKLVEYGAFLQRTDVVLRLLAALLVSAHLVVLNLCFRRG